ncbi:MAG: hypothetical protein ACI8RD_014891 [Bacillariaceae sp.]
MESPYNQDLSTKKDVPHAVVKFLCRRRRRKKKKIIGITRYNKTIA